MSRRAQPYSLDHTSRRNPMRPPHCVGGLALRPRSSATSGGIQSTLHRFVHVSGRAVPWVGADPSSISGQIRDAPPPVASGASPALLPRPLPPAGTPLGNGDMMGQAGGAPHCASPRLPSAPDRSLTNSGYPCPPSPSASAPGCGSQRTLHHFWTPQSKRHGPQPAVPVAPGEVQPTVSDAAAHAGAGSRSLAVPDLSRTVPAMIHSWEDQTRAASSPFRTQSSTPVLARTDTALRLRPRGVLPPPHPSLVSPREPCISEPAGVERRLGHVQSCPPRAATPLGTSMSLPVSVTAAQVTSPDIFPAGTPAEEVPSPPLPCLVSRREQGPYARLDTARPLAVPAPPLPAYPAGALSPSPPQGLHGALGLLRPP